MLGYWVIPFTFLLNRRVLADRSPSKLDYISGVVSLENLFTKHSRKDNTLTFICI